MVLANNSNAARIFRGFAQEEIPFDRVAVSMPQGQRAFGLAKGIISEYVEVRFAGDDSNLSIDSFKKIVLNGNVSVNGTRFAVTQTNRFKAVVPTLRSITKVIPIDPVKGRNRVGRFVQPGHNLGTNVSLVKKTVMVDSIVLTVQ